ncbi:Transcriptional activator [Cytospora paraplurivora]|uniref:Transcriptional activator n=1 Tax=Cytospora paraplurivora TaxID=2898453 RepID=A0AAN9U417_9PEZI
MAPVSSSALSSSPTKIGIGETAIRPVAYLRHLEAKVKAYEDADAALRTRNTTDSTTIRTPVVNDEDEGFEDDIRLPEAFTQLNVESPGNSSTARQLFAAQYTYIGTIFSFTSPAAFEELLQEVYQGPPQLSDQKACLAHAKVLIILAFGKMYSVNQWIDYNGPPGFEYFTLALEVMPDLHEEGSIPFIETLALVGYFMQNLNRRDAAFLYIGAALRMAVTLGLHQETPNSDLDDATKEHRRRVWWSVYSLDRIHSVKSGNPITIHDEDVGVALPSKLPEEAEYCPAVVLRHYTQLSQICGKITTSIYRRTPKKGSTLMAAVQKIITALSQWHRELPDELRFDPARLSISRESVSTLLHYSQCVNMTARPLLFHVVQKRLKAGLAGKEHDWKQGLTQTTVKVIEMCVSAAKDTINMMTIAAQKNLVATYGYMDSEHAFSAAIVLVMVCVAFPTDQRNIESMNAALELLHGMSQRGNSHMAARYDLLAHLRATSIPGAVPPRAMQAEAVPPSVRSPAFLPPNTSMLSHRPPPKGPGSENPLTSGQPTAQSPPSFSNPFGSSIPIPDATMELRDPRISSFSPRPGSQLPELMLFNNASLDEGMFYDVDMTGVVCNDNQDFWEEAFANPLGDPGNTLMESLEWTQAAMDQFGGRDN